MVRTDRHQPDLPAGLDRLARSCSRAIPYNRELARQSRCRLDAELVRDNALAISGLLVAEDRRAEREAVSAGRLLGEPELPGARRTRPSQGEDQYRRGLYTWWQRSFLHPSLLAFDAPSREECAAERSPLEHPAAGARAAERSRPTSKRRASSPRASSSEGGGDTRAADRLGLAAGAAARSAAADEIATLDAHCSRSTGATMPSDPRGRRGACSRSGSRPRPDGVDPAELAAWTQRRPRDPEPARNHHPELRSDGSPFELDSSALSSSRAAPFSAAPRRASARSRSASLLEPALLARPRRGQVAGRRQPAASSAEGQARHLADDGGRAVAPGDVRLQAEAGARWTASRCRRA